MKKILVPTDFSVSSIHGLEYAASIARKSKAKLYIFNVAQTGNYYYANDPSGIAQIPSTLIEGINENLRKASFSKLEVLKKRDFLKGLKVEIDCTTSPNIHNPILEFADRKKTDLIVMGTKGSGNIKSILLGSTAERVVRFSTHPVIVTPGKAGKGMVKLIVFASDFEEEAYSIFPVVKRFAKLFGAKIILLKVNTMDQFSRTSEDKYKVKNFSRKFGGNYEMTVYNDFMKEEGILNFAGETKADLIAIGTHGKRGLKRFFTEDVSEGIVRLSSIPIMIVNLRKYKYRTDILSE